MKLILLNERRKIEVTFPYVDKEEKKRQWGTKEKENGQIPGTEEKFKKYLKNVTKSLVWGKKRVKTNCP